MTFARPGEGGDVRVMFTMLGLVMLIRKVLSNIVLGRPRRHFSIDLLQLYMGFRDVLGDDDVRLPTKYLSRWICPITGHLRCL